MRTVHEGADRWRRVATSFDAIVDLDALAQHAHLAALRAEDPSLAEEVERLLVADTTGDGVLDRGLDSTVAESALDALAFADRSGTQLGEYSLLRRIGRGGMGEVYLAERAGEGYSQRVAVKVLRRGVDTEDVVRRFAQERRILARLEHPGIARLIDGGATPDGTPYLVMELVDGEPLAQYAQRASVTLDARLALVVAICRAVDFAHRRLVVHRDLKPSNVLVTADGTPKLLDFGIAKLIGDATEDTVTGSAMRVLSPAYAAPEQIVGEPVGTTTDVYALGVILYELLAGRLPHDRHARSLDALARAVSDETIERPSVAARRGGSGAARDIDADLDTIVLQALAREPERRYPTAAALADDLERFRAGRPIGARPATWRYRAAKFVARHRLAVAVASAALVALVAALGFALVQAERARAEAQRAASQAARAERVKEFVLALFREQDPLTRDKARAATAGELVARGIAAAQRDFAQDAELESEVVGDLADLQFSLGDVKAARESYAALVGRRKAHYGEDSVPYGAALADLGGAQLALGERDEAGATIERSVELLRRLAGADAIETADAEMRLQRLKLERGDNDESLALADHVLAVYVREKGATHVDTLRRRYNRGVVLEALDRLDDAEKELREVVAAHERAGSPDHVQLVYPRTLLGDVLRRKRDYPAAAAMYDQALDAATRELGAQHRVTGQIGMRRGDLLRRLRRYDEAEAALALAEAAFVPLQSPELGQVYVYRGQVYREQRRYTHAIRWYERAVEHYGRTIGPETVYARGAELSLAATRAESGDVERGVADARRVATALRAKATPGTFDHAFAAENLGDVLALAGRHDEALVEHRAARDVLEALYGPKHTGVATLEFAVAKDLIALGRDAAQARARLDAALAALRASDPSEPMVGEVLLASATLARADGDVPRAAREFAEALASLELTHGADHALTHAARAGTTAE